METISFYVYMLFPITLRILLGSFYDIGIHKLHISLYTWINSNDLYNTKDLAEVFALT